MSSVFSPLACAVLNSFNEGVVVFDPEGRVMYTNHPAEETIESLDKEISRDATGLLPQLARKGARIAPIRVGGLKVGEAVFVPILESARSTLADQERQAILQTLQGTGWKLAESARRLGISRTTLWRRLKEYGLHRDGRGRWSQVS
jgi:transcriptional regulator of acetoin/glycerol metabolism